MNQIAKILPLPVQGGHGPGAVNHGRYRKEVFCLTDTIVALVVGVAMFIIALLGLVVKIIELSRK